MRLCLCFTYTNTPYWWTRFLRPGFTHVYLLQKVPGGVIRLDPHFNVVELTYHPEGEICIHDQTTIMLELEMEPQYTLKRPLIQALTCVEYVKSVMGISKWSLWTPYQLYRHVLSCYPHAEFSYMR